MKDPQLLHALDMQQQMPAPANVRRQCREKINGRDRRRRERGQQRQRIGLAKRTQRMRPSMKTESPGRGVPSMRGEVTPVLGDQPQAGEGGKCGGEAVVDKPRQRPDRKRDQNQQTQMPVVPASAEEVHPRAERMTLDPKTTLPPPARPPPTRA